jgi:hypothetical protein
MEKTLQKVIWQSIAMEDTGAAPAPQADSKPIRVYAGEGAEKRTQETGKRRRLTIAAEDQQTG